MTNADFESGVGPLCESSIGYLCCTEDIFRGASSGCHAEDAERTVINLKMLDA
jgi:hypothetical protein